MSDILIVGADRGIGYYMVKRLLEKGNNVAVLDICTENISKLTATYPDSLLICNADATDEASLLESINSVINVFGKIDIAIHNACLCTFEAEQDTDYEVYRRVMEVNYYGALRLAKLVLPLMREKKSGKIIFTSSGVGVTGFGNISPYASSKGAIESLAKCLEIENQAYGVTFHIMHPPLTDTASASGLPVPKAFMADAPKVGTSLADNIFSKKFIICHSMNQALQMKLCYSHPIYMGKMMWKMTQRAKE